MSVLFVAILVVALLRRTDAESQHRVALVEEGDVEDVVLAEGALEGRTQVDVGAQASGQVKSLKVRVGDKVTKGQLLAEIDPTVAENELKADQAREDELVAKMAGAHASLFEAEMALRRHRAMLAADATSRREYLAAEAEYRRQRANLEGLKADVRGAHMKLEIAKAHLDFTKIVAPSDGEVVAIVAREGQTVNAQEQTPVIIKLADLDTMTVKAEVSEADVYRTRIGQNACFTTLGEPEQRYCGKLRSIEPAPRGYLESARQRGGGEASGHHAVFYNALFDVQNPKHKLRIGMTAEVSVAINTAKRVATIPAEALGARTADGSYEVKVINQRGETERRSVRIGLNNNLKAEVRDGLSVGDRVIKDGEAESNASAESATSEGT
nr:MULTISPECIES: efflux RND transporter periplasmic adaptor subunit [unclassified Caballeronia]